MLTRHYNTAPSSLGVQEEWGSQEKKKKMSSLREMGSIKTSILSPRLAI